ncbi:Xanthine phosphoribosyltransferase [archaeon HR04]|nr:Xanthine phosphoribosyltransferase [archaeon HR04]
MKLLKRCIDWDEVSRLCSLIADKIRDDGVSIGCILAVARGGIVPAMIIAEMLSVDDIDLIRARHYQGMMMDEDVSIEFITPLQDMQKKIDRCRREGRIMLVVDDIADTGLTIKAVVDALGKGGKSNDTIIAVTTLYMKPRSIFKPDYYAEICRDDEWIVFPWEQD